MASKKADYESLMVQEFLSKAQAMAYTNFKSEEAFDEMIAPWCHVYRNSDGRSEGDTFCQNCGSANWNWLSSSRQIHKSFTNALHPITTGVIVGQITVLL